MSDEQHPLDYAPPTRRRFSQLRVLACLGAVMALVVAGLLLYMLLLHMRFTNYGPWGM